VLSALPDLSRDSRALSCSSINVNDGPSQSGRAKNEDTRSGNGNQRDGAWSVGDQIVVASTDQSLPKSAGRGNAERTRTRILPPGPLTCRESNSRRFDKSGGSAGVNVASFSFFLTLFSGRDKVAQDDLGQSARCRSLSYQNRINHRGRLRARRIKDQ